MAPSVPTPGRCSSSTVEPLVSAPSAPASEPIRLKRAKVSTRVRASDLLREDGLLYRQERETSPEVGFAVPMNATPRSSASDELAAYATPVPIDEERGPDQHPPRPIRSTYCPTSHVVLTSR